MSQQMESGELLPAQPEEPKAKKPRKNKKLVPTPVSYDATPGGPNNHYKGLGNTAKHGQQAGMDDLLSLTSSQGGSLVSHSVWPGSDVAAMMTATSGMKCFASSASSDPLGLLARMLMGSSAWRSPFQLLKWECIQLFEGRKKTYLLATSHNKKSCSYMSSLKVLKVKGTTPSLSLFRLSGWEPGTNDSVSLSLPEEGKPEMFPTPNTMDGLPPRSHERILRYNQEARPGRKYVDRNLREQIFYGRQWPAQLFPTPEVDNQEGYQVSGGKKWPRLGAVARMFPTPQSASESPAAHNQINGTLKDVVRRDRDEAVASDKSQPARSDSLNQEQPSLFPTPRTRGLLGGSGLREMMQAKVLNGELTEAEASEIMGVRMFPTPRSRDWKGAGYPGDLPSAVLFPTPRSGKMTDEDEATWKARQAEGKVSTPPLALAVRLLPTPTADDTNNATRESGDFESLTRAVMEGELGNLSPAATDAPHGTLNPRWVEWLMGFPDGWTSFGLSATPSSPSKSTRSTKPSRGSKAKAKVEPEVEVALLDLSKLSVKEPPPTVETIQNQEEPHKTEGGSVQAEVEAPMVVQETSSDEAWDELVGENAGKSKEKLGEVTSGDASAPATVEDSILQNTPEPDSEKPVTLVTEASPKGWHPIGADARLDPIWRKMAIPEWRGILAESQKDGDQLRERYARHMLNDVLKENVA